MQAITDMEEAPDIAAMRIAATRIDPLVALRHE